MRRPSKTDCRRFDDAAPESRSICHLDMGSDAPDTSRQDAVGERMTDLTEDQWAWVQQKYEEAAPDRAAAAEMARKVSEGQLNSMGLQDQVTKSYIDDRNNLFRPLEQKIVTEADQYDTPERREAKAGQAVADAGQQISLAQAAQRRTQQRMGVNPMSGAATSMDNQMSLGEASLKTGAANQAREAVELQGYARKMDAANLGRGLASSQATSAGVALNQGNSAVGNAQVPNATNNQGIGVVGQGAGSAVAGLGGAAGVYQSSTNAKVQAGDNSGAMGALGSVVGAAVPYLFAMSDENMKTDREPVDPKISLAAIRKLPPAESWRYKGGTEASDGGKTHVGPMAQDVQASLGDTTAPGGKAIDLVSMNGHLTNAVKALDKKVIALENKRKAA